MPEVMRIRSRAAFSEALAGARVDACNITDPALHARVAAQLDHMARTTADDRVPTDDERAAVNLGPLAARHLETPAPRLADTLEELDYTFRRYPQLHAVQAARRGVLQVWSGPETFRKLVLEPGEPRTVGTADADLVVPGDPPHGPQFRVVWDGVGAHVLACEPHRLRIAGVPAWHGELANRGWLTAGATTFCFFVEDWTPPPAPPRPATLTDRVLAELRPRAAAGTLYAVVDAARSARARALLCESVDAYASLYDGEQGRAFDEVAPHLVHLRGDSGLLDRLVGEGWGDAWCVWPVAGSGFDAVRRHLRKFLRVEDPGDRRRLLFRFYDPRVLRRFADIITAEQAAELTSGLDAWLFEREDGGLDGLRR